MADAWEEIQAIKSKRINLKERLQKRRKEVGDILAAGQSSEDPSVSKAVGGDPVIPGSVPIKDISLPNVTEKGVELQVLQILISATLSFPSTSKHIARLAGASLKKEIGHSVLVNLLQKFAARELISVVDSTKEGEVVLEVVSADHTRLVALAHDIETQNLNTGQRFSGSNDGPEPAKRTKVATEDEGKEEKREQKDDVMSLLSLPSAKEKLHKKVGEEILELLSKPTAKERSLAERFRSQGGAQVREFCPQATREECLKIRGDGQCKKLHFRKILQSHTDEALGDCSFLNTCFHMDTCKYVHYEVDSFIPEEQDKDSSKDKDDPASSANKTALVENKPVILFPPQWIQCDIRVLDMSILGTETKFSVIMADPPWDIHMELPYGTMSDDEMRQLNIPALQDEGLFFLWVTVRAMELGRECLQLWGYERVDEIIWVKTNQLQRIIRTGRTGHWLNHGKEHCLVGMKGNPANLNRGLDCDVIVAEVRATSHKPDEIYGIIERLSPGTRKIELFGRPHNVQPNWITLGNQLEGVHLLDPEIARAFKKRYPDGIVSSSRS